jgi:hypothetical protein
MTIQEMRRHNFLLMDLAAEEDDEQCDAANPKQVVLTGCVQRLSGLHFGLAHTRQSLPLL